MRKAAAPLENNREKCAKLNRLLPLSRSTIMLGYRQGCEAKRLPRMFIEMSILRGQRSPIRDCCAWLMV
jgi:hypothetical protein